MTDIVVRTKLAKYLTLRQEIKDLKKEMEDTRDELVPYIKSQGRENAAGSRVLELDNPVKMGEDNFQALQYTRKSSKRLNEDFIKEFIKAVSDDDFTEHHLDVIKTVEVVDQDAWWNLFVQDLIDEDTFEKGFTETVSWAFNPIAE
ncbi:host nuclease inhibitor [Streptomyces phage LuckySocke]|nr:host nuclease inhibitor [Streptomyces phage Alone3]WPH58943.1 host nuclease inhibitor [Streptomyces phage LuckySocke]